MVKTIVVFLLYGGFGTEKIATYLAMIGLYWTHAWNHHQIVTVDKVGSTFIKWHCFFPWIKQKRTGEKLLGHQKGFAQGDDMNLDDPTDYILYNHIYIIFIYIYMCVCIHTAEGWFHELNRKFVPFFLPVPWSHPRRVAGLRCFVRRFEQGFVFSCASQLATWPV